MGMKQTLDVINRLEADGAIRRYAIAGAVAAYNYIEPTLTEDLDLLISFDQKSEKPQPGLITLQPVLTQLKRLGYDQFQNEGILIEGWPVQFLPVADDLDAEALAQARDTEILIPNAGGSVNTRLLRAEHLVAIALRIGRPKDFIRIAQFVEAKSVDLNALRKVLHRHKLLKAWQSFCFRVGIKNPLSA